MENYEDFVKVFIEKIDTKLAPKTGWGRNEIKLIIGEALTEAMAKQLDNKKPANISASGSTC